MRINKNCVVCNGVFSPLVAEVNRGRGLVCSKVCRHKRQAEVMSGRKRTPEQIEKQRKAMKGRIRTEAHSQNISKGLMGKYAGELNGNWRGGTYESQGRWYIRVNDHPYKHQNGYILRSHYVVEQVIKRYLEPGEHIHHINFKKDDDRPENLYIFPSESEHTRYHQLVKSNKYTISVITESNLSNY